MNAKGKLIPYLRKSSGEDEEQSFARQRAAIQKWAEANSVPLGDEILDPGVSAKKHWRDRRLGEAVEVVRRGEASGIVVEELSRLTRGRQLHAAELWDALAEADARLVCTAEGLDTAHGDQELNYGLRALLAREQWKQYARRMADFKQRKTTAGVAFGPMPIGYRKDADGRAEVDSETAPIVRELFERRLRGEGVSSLARFLRERTGRKWTRQAVSFILGNELYRTGRVQYGEAVSEHEAGAIVDPTTWFAVQRAPMPSTRGPSRWLLSGMIYCGVCGNRLEPSITTGGTAKKYRYYRCLNKDCPAKPRPGGSAEKLEAHVMETLWTFVGSRERRPHSAPDLKSLADRVEMTQRLWEEVRTAEMQQALGDEWPATVQARRLDHEEALATLGEAEAVDPEPADVTDLRERWPEMSDAERRAALDRYHVARIVVSASKPDGWQVVWK